MGRKIGGAEEGLRGDEPQTTVNSAQLSRWINERGWTMAQAATALGLTKAGLAKKLNGTRAVGAQTEMLIAYINNLGGEPLVELPKWRGRGRPSTKTADRGPITGSVIDAQIGGESRTCEAGRACSVPQQRNAFRPKPVRSAESPSSETRIPNTVAERMLSRPSTANPSISPVQLPEKPVIRSKTNPSYQKRIDALAAMAEAYDWSGIQAYEVKGINTYAKMVARYRDQLLQCAPRGKDQVQRTPH